MKLKSKIILLITILIVFLMQKIIYIIMKHNYWILLEKEILAKTSNSIIPNVSGDFIRTEKNYTIIILEKLSSQSIQLGHDITNIYRLRDFYIKQLENITELMDVLYVRDTAIIHFTKIMHDFLSGSCSSFVKSVIQFIGLNLYSSINHLIDFQLSL